MWFIKRAWAALVSFAAVIRVVVVGEKRCVTTLITAAKETRAACDVTNVCCLRFQS